MTVVNPKSISGINSITTGSGSDNLLTIHTSDASSTERVRINSSGDVIVGSGITVSPDGDIFATGVTTSTTFSGNFSGGTVSGTTGTFTGDVDIADKIVHTGDTDTAIRFSGADTITAETGGTERLRITSTGEVGINMTPSNGQMLAITGRSGYDDIVQVTAVGTNMGARINLTNTGTGVARINATNNDLALQTGGTERLRIDSSGHLSFAGTTEEITLQTSDGSDTGYLNLSGGGACAQTRGAQLVMSGNERSGGLGGILQLLAGNSGSTGVIQFFTGGAETMRLQSGGGISFNGDTATANALNDYEEGSWTPSLVNWSVSESTTNAGKYTKIGNFVQISWNQSLTAVDGGYTGSGSGAYIGSLPFTVADCVVVSFSGSTLWNSNMQSIDNIGNNLYYRSNPYTTNGIASDSMFNSSGVVKFTATYRTDQ